MSTEVIALVLIVGVAAILGGVSMLSDWRRIGTRWAVSVITWQERVRRRLLTRDERQIRQLSVFGGVLKAPRRRPAPMIAIAMPSGTIG